MIYSFWAVNYDGMWIGKENKTDALALAKEGQEVVKVIDYHTYSELKNEFKKEKAEDVLRDFVEQFHPDDYETDDSAFDLIHRAKAVLGVK